MHKRLIYHAGAWAGNFGDSIIHQSIRNAISKFSGYELEFRDINCQQTEFTMELINQINSQGNMLIVGGGGLIFYRPQDNSKSGWQWNIDINLIDAITIPVVLYGVGYNQFEYDASDFIPVTNPHLQKTVKCASIFSVRNHGSKRELIARGCDGEKIEVVPDSGMFAESKDVLIPGLNKKKLKIGFNWTSDREDQTFPPPHNENKNKFINACCDLLNYAITEKNAQVFHIGHMSSEFDKNIIAALKGNLISEPIIIDDVLRKIYPPSQERAGYLVDVYRQMDIILGMRGHANIVSFGQNTPFIGLGSHRKVRYFLEDVGLEKYFFDVRLNENTYTIEKMKCILNSIIEDLSQHRKFLRNSYNAQEKIFNNFNRKVISLLN